MSEQWTLADLRRANEARQDEWCPDQKPDLAFRAMELAGEAGEACNVAKKLVRERSGWRGSRSTPAELGAELADLVICADLCAMAEGIDLMAAVRAKFNATSEKVGLATRLSPIPADAASEREAFERWASGKGYRITTLSQETRDNFARLAPTYTPGDYEYARTQAAWEGWQGRVAK